MKFAYHHISVFIIFGLMWIIFQEITFSSILLPIVINSVPDVDLKFKSHRNLFYHSIIFPMLILVFNPSIYSVLLTFSFGLHCICDIRLTVCGGYYTLKIWKGHPIRGYRFATTWYISNFLISLGLLTFWLIIF